MTIRILVYDDTKEKMHLEDWQKANDRVTIAEAQGNKFSYERIASDDEDDNTIYLKWYIDFADEAAYALWKISI